MRYCGGGGGVGCQWQMKIVHPSDSFIQRIEKRCISDVCVCVCVYVHSMCVHMYIFQAVLFAKHQVHPPRQRARTHTSWNWFPHCWRYVTADAAATATAAAAYACLPWWQLPCQLHSIFLFLPTYEQQAMVVPMLYIWVFVTTHTHMVVAVVVMCNFPICGCVEYELTIVVMHWLIDKNINASFAYGVCMCVGLCI